MKFIDYVLLLLAIIIGIWLLNPVAGDAVTFSITVATWVLLCSIKKPQYIITYLKSNLPSLLFVCVLFMFSILGHVRLPISLFFFLLSFSIGLYYIQENNHFANKIIILSFLVYILSICINSLVAYEVVPGLSRMLSTGDPNEIMKTRGADYITPFIATYGIIYICPVLIILFYSITKNSNNTLTKVVLYLLVILFAWWVFKAEFTIALLLSIAFLGYLLFYNFQSKNGNLHTNVFFGLLILLISFFGSDLFSMLSEMVPSYNFSVRFKEIADTLEGDVSANTDIGARGSLYQVSINAFLSNPIFGAGDKNLYVDYGNHSTILDAFAKYGLLGGSLNLLYFYKPISCVKLHLSETSKSIYNICLLYVLVIALINIADTKPMYCILFILGPLLLSELIDKNR